MRSLHRNLLALALLALVAFGALRPSTQAPERAPQVQTAPVAAEADFGALALHFEANRGQLPAAADFAARGPDYSVLLAPNEAVLALGAAAPLRMRLAGARETQAEGLDRLPGTVNVFRGSDPAAWRSGIPTFARVRYASVYPGVDLVYHGHRRQLEYDFVVAPGADPDQVRLAWEGAERVELEPGGDLLLHTPDGVVRQRAPLAYQEREGERVSVSSRYLLDGEMVCMAVGDYDRERPLVIDPVIVDYATYLGGSALDYGWDVDVDAAGNMYLTGSTQSTDFPLQNPFQSTYSGNHGDVFVSKISADGQTLVYSTYVGGSVGDGGRGIAVDAAGHAYVTGVTGGSASFNNFPVVNAIQPTYGGTDDGILFKLSADGSQLLFSTYLGGGATDLMVRLELAPDGTIVIAGGGGDGWPTTPGAYDTNPPFIGSKGAVARVAPDGSALLASTFFPVNAINDLALDSGGRVYLTGRGGGFPATPGAFQPQSNGGDAYMAVLSADLTTLEAGTYLGGSQSDRGEGIDVDAAGDAYITGRTESNDASIVPFPTTPGVFQPNSGPGTVPAFAAKISGDATTLIYSTFLGGSVRTEPFDLAVDSQGRAYLTGENASADFPTVDPLQPCTPWDGDDAFVAQVSPDASTLLFSSCFAAAFGRAIRVDPAGRAHITGRVGTSGSFPVVNPLQANNAGNGDAFLLRLSFESIEPYCTCTSGAPCGNTDPGAGCANATGSGGLLTAAGSTSVSADDLFLTASQLPANVNGLFFMGSQQTAPFPFHNGLLCVGGGGMGLQRFAVQNAGAQGTFARGPIVGYSQANFAPAFQIGPGQVWNFQAWYRDAQGPCGGSSNLTNGLSITFTP